MTPIPANPLSLSTPSSAAVLARLKRSGMVVTLLALVLLALPAYTATVAIAAHRLAAIELSQNFPSARDTAPEALAYTRFTFATAFYAGAILVLGLAMVITARVAASNRKEPQTPIHWALYPLFPLLAWCFAALFACCYAAIPFGIPIRLPHLLAQREAADVFWKQQHEADVAAMALWEKEHTGSQHDRDVAILTRCQRELAGRRSAPADMLSPLQQINRQLTSRSEPLDPDLKTSLLATFRDFRDDFARDSRVRNEALATLKSLDPILGYQFEIYYKTGCDLDRNAATAAQSLDVARKDLVLAIYRRNPADLDSILNAHQVPFDKPVDDSGRNLLTMAIDSDLPDLLDVLYKHDADLEAPISRGYTPLQLALVNHHPHAALYLIQKGANVNTLTSPATRISNRYPPGTSPLVLALYLLNADVVEALLNKGADPNLTTPAHGLALDTLRSICRDHRRDPLERALLAHGARSTPATTQPSTNKPAPSASYPHSSAP